MSNIIQTVAYTADDARLIRERLSDHLGTQSLTVFLKEGVQLEGIISEVGKDYIALISDRNDLLVPLSSILYVQYSH